MYNCWLSNQCLTLLLTSFLKSFRSILLNIHRCESTFFIDNLEVISMQLKAQNKACMISMKLPWRWSNLFMGIYLCSYDNVSLTLTDVTQDCVSKLEQYLPLNFKFHPCSNVSNMTWHPWNVHLSWAYFSSSQSFFMPLWNQT